MKVSWSLYGLNGIEGLIGEASICESKGLNGVWYPDYQAPLCNWPELYTVLTSIALSSKRLFIGSLVTDVLRRHPMVTAHAFASLSHIAPGRVILGLGGGGGTSHLPYGIEMDHLSSKLEEGITMIRSLWNATEHSPAEFGAPISD